MVFVGGSRVCRPIRVTRGDAEHFTIGLSAQYLASIIIGGLGSVTGAIFMTLLPKLLRIPERALAHRWNKIKAYWKLWPFSY